MALKGLPLLDLETASAVSRHWRAVAVGNRQLWSTVENVPAEHLARVLARSGSLPIFVSLSYGRQEDHATTCSAIQAHMGRIEHLLLTIDRATWGLTCATALDDAPLSLLLRAPAPRLRELSLTLGFARGVCRGQLFGGAAPRLRHVFLSGIDFQEPQAAFSQVIDFTTDAMWHDEHSDRWHNLDHIADLQHNFPAVRHMTIEKFNTLTDIIPGPSTLPPLLLSMHLDFSLSLDGTLEDVLKPLEWGRWDSLRAISIKQPPEGLFAYILDHLPDIDAFILDDDLIRVVTRSHKTYAFTIVSEEDMEHVVRRAGSLTQLHLGPEVAVLLGQEYLARLFAAAPSIRILTLHLSGPYWLNSCLDGYALKVPSLQQLHITAPPRSTGVALLPMQDVTWMLAKVLGFKHRRRRLSALVLWGYELGDTKIAMPVMCTYTRTHPLDP